MAWSYSLDRNWVFGRSTMEKLVSERNAFLRVGYLASRCVYRSCLFRTVNMGVSWSLALVARVVVAVELDIERLVRLPCHESIWRDSVMGSPLTRLFMLSNEDGLLGDRCGTRGVARRAFGDDDRRCCRRCYGRRLILAARENHKHKTSHECGHSVSLHIVSPLLV